ncbi:MAG: hypothetical protein L0H93_13005 [Nocardioides sp.]|nr:hypothetical protein [Nocardioides sp.]
MELKDNIAESFGDGPPQPPIDDHVAAGRRALRRRRATAGVATLAVAGLIGGTSWLATSGPGDDSGADDQTVATAPSASQSTDPGATATPADYVPTKRDFLGEPALLHRGETYLAKGWREVVRIDNPMEYDATNASVGLEVRMGGQHKFVLVSETGGDDGDISTPRDRGLSTISDDAEGTLADWLETATANQHQLDVDNNVVPPDKVSGPLVTMTNVGKLLPRSDLRIVEQITDVDLGPRFSGPEHSTAAARLDMPTGKDVYVVVRRSAGSKAEVIRGGTAGTFPTMAAFLDHARTAYGEDNGEGLR